MYNTKIDFIGIFEDRKLFFTKLPSYLNIKHNIKNKAPTCIPLANPPPVSGINSIRYNKTIKNIEIQCQSVVKGDARVAEIAAASILAKVERDRQMYELDKQYPEYQFAKHKGYPTKLHLDLLNELPILPCYRKTYAPVRKVLEAKNI